MTTEQQIEKQLNDEYVKFSNGIYSGKVEVPKNIIDLFKKGVMAMSPFAHKINFNKVKIMSSKKVNELTYADLTDMIKVVLSTVLNVYHEDFDTAVKEHIKIEKFVLSFNSDVNDFQEKLKMKRTTLQSLANPQRSSRLQLIN